MTDDSLQRSRLKSLLIYVKFNGSINYFSFPAPFEKELVDEALRLGLLSRRNDDVIVNKSNIREISNV